MTKWDYLFETDEELRKLEKKSARGSAQDILIFARAMERAGKLDGDPAFSPLDANYWRRVLKRNSTNVQIRAHWVNACQTEGRACYRVVIGHRTYRTYEENPDNREMQDWEEDLDEDEQTLQEVIDFLQDHDYKTNKPNWRAEWETEDEPHEQGTDGPGENWMDDIEFNIAISYTDGAPLLLADRKRFNTFLTHRGRPYTSYADDWPKIDTSDRNGRKILR